MSLKTSIRRDSRQQKFNRLSGAMAVNIAKQRKDPDAVRLAKFKKLFFKFKDKIKKKYAMKGRQVARKSLN
jgi:hypothetical protein